MAAPALTEAFQQIAVKCGLQYTIYKHLSSMLTIFELQIREKLFSAKTE